MNKMHVIKQSLIPFLTLLKKSFLHLVYPSTCLHCQTLLPPESIVICHSCSTLLDLITPHHRCLMCFNLMDESSHGICQECSHYPSHYVRTGSAFEYAGPPASLVKHLKYSNKPFLSKGMAAFMVAQLDQLDWPLPDALIPVPISLTHLLDRGYNQSRLLAEEMSLLLQCPVLDVLKRQPGDFSQAALNLEQRKALEGKRFSRKNKFSVEGKTLLVIDDVMTSGLTLQRCAEALLTGSPKALYALTFCRA